MIIVKTFETFGDSTSTFDQKVNLILLIQNIGTGQGGFDLDKVLDPVHFPKLSTTINNAGLADIPERFPKFSIREKGSIEKLYDWLDRRYKLNDLPNINDIIDYFIEIKELGHEVEESIVLVKVGSKISYGKVEMDKTHFKFRIVMSDIRSDLNRIKYLDLQDSLEILISKLEDEYKVDFVIGGNSDWVDYKVLITSK